MLTGHKLKTLQELIASSSKEELAWINGYLTGLVSNGQLIEDANGYSVNTVPKITKKISLVYGTETGNAKKLTTSLAAVAKKKGINPKIISLDQYKLNDLEKEEYFFVVISTQGEGEPPNGAKKFYDYIHERELKLPNLKYSVLALGDTSYPLYCKTGEDVDAKFQEFGAQRVVEMQRCDVDYEQDAHTWFGKVLSLIEESTTVVPQVQPPPEPTKKATGKKYYQGIVSTNINLNDRGSEKQTFHIEITAEEKIDYLPGDALAIIPENKKWIVETIIKLTGIDRDLILQTSKKSARVEELLTRHLNICYLLSSAVKKYATITEQEIPDTRMDLVDLVRIYPVKNATQFAEIIKILPAIAPRLYSISSAPAAHDNEIHLTVGRHSFQAKNEERFGLCSEFLGELPVGTSVSFYIHKNRSFKLPADDKDIIMIGPGTGIAPFRAFLAQRDATGAPGKNWFFFGEQHFISDFLYQVELQNFVQTGVLNRLDLAFSRDQEQKLYVQHRMMQNATELYNWLDNGAHLYISGTKDPMSKDVENTLLQIISEKGNKTAEEARLFLEKMSDENRYEKDVY
ncbi:MAG: flavodoxin domain-containing protein [Chitinophagaceae bacterium]|nr:flavodoxin domain-containing protein [Chitinophagaceae bacterium]